MNFLIPTLSLLSISKASDYFLVESQYGSVPSYIQSVDYCNNNDGQLIHYTPNEYAVCCRGCIDCNNDCTEVNNTVFQHFHSQNMNDIENFINVLSPASVSRIFGGISYPDLHVWVANDASGKEYAFRLTDWNINTFVGTNNDIDIAADKVMLIGFKPTPAPYAYWVEEINNPLNYISCVDQTSLFQHKWSQDMQEIEDFINQMKPSSVARIFGGVSYPDLHVWVANDNSDKQYAFHLGNWGSFVGTNTDIHIADDKVMFFDFKPVPQPYAYWVEEI